MIEVDQIRKRYNGSRGLDGFTLRVEKGELFGLVGPNGAGKTTLIKILSTLIRPDSGAASIAGIDVTANPRGVKRVVGYMPDQPGLYQDMRVLEFLEFFADAFRIPSGHRRSVVDKALQDSGLAPRRDSYVEELSFGMKQRLFLAKTLLHSPQVLLLDEPATGLDPMARVDLRNQLKRLNQQGITILISSHILVDLEEICTRVAFIADGKNQADESGRTVIELRKEDASQPRLYEIEVLQDAAPAAQHAAAFAGVTVLDVQPSRFVVQISAEPARAAEFLRHLVTGGVQVVKFDRPPANLEQRYRSVFGGQPR
ncbi:MAG: ABC transporter ATP-binding protein [Candidatus Acidiferrales bacterium]